MHSRLPTEHIRKNIVLNQFFDKKSICQIGSWMTMKISKVDWS